VVDPPEQRGDGAALDVSLGPEGPGGLAAGRGPDDPIAVDLERRGGGVEGGGLAAPATPTITSTDRPEEQTARTASTWPGVRKWPISSSLAPMAVSTSAVGMVGPGAVTSRSTATAIACSAASTSTVA